MNRLIVSLMTVLLALTAAPAPAEEAQVSGSVEVGLRAVDQKGSGAKFLEYRDLDDGTFSDVSLEAYKGDRYLDLSGENLGLDDQSYLLRGGRFGDYKYAFHYELIPHNLSFGARSIYSNVGSADLTYAATDRPKDTDAAYTPAIPTEPALWTAFDYGIERKNYGGEVEFSFATPFFLRLKAERTETDGVKPLGAASGVVADFTGAQFSPFGNIVEMPEPVDYKTSDLTLETGYRTREMTLTLAALLSTFENANDYLSWRNPYVTTEELSEINGLAPDNDYYKVSARLTKRLPLHSLLAVQASRSKLESEFDLLSTSATDNHPDFSGNSPVYSETALGLNRDRFEGDITYTTASVALSSRPTKKLDTRVHYSYLDKDNDSDVVVFSDGAGSVHNHIFEYDKQSAGVDLGYKLTASTKASAGYEFKTVDREREDAESTRDHRFFVQLKNSSLDWLTAKAKYQRLERSSDFEKGDAGTDPTDSNYVNRFVRRYDATDKSQDTISLALEFYPAGNLDLGLEYAYKLDDYDETELGRTEDERHELYLDAAWQLPGSIRLGGFVGYEKSSTSSDSRNFVASADPGAGTVGGDYNWSQELESDYYAYGVTAEVPLVTDKLDLLASWRYGKSDGENSFASEGATLLENIDKSDDYSRQTLEAKAIYRFSEQLRFALGCLYEKYRYSDAQYDGYSAYNSGVFNSHYLSGAYADSDYEASVGYLTASYTF